MFVFMCKTVVFLDALIMYWLYCDYFHILAFGGIHGKY